MTPDMIRAVMYGLFATPPIKPRNRINLRESFHEPQAVTVPKFKRPRLQRSKRK